METREQTAAKDLKIAAIDYAVKLGDKRLVDIVRHDDGYWYKR